MKLTTRASIEVPRPVEEVFDLAVSCEGLPKFLRVVGPIPGIARAEMYGGAELATGAQRRVTMSDGSVMEEDVLAVDRPKLHRYRWERGPKPPFSWLVKNGEAEWAFAPSGEGCRVDWSYTFELTSPAASPLAALALVFFRRWMIQGLAELKTVAAT